MQSNNWELEQLKQQLSSVKRSAWKPIVQEGDGNLTASKFAGKPWLSVDETWPICPNCQKPMQLFLQLNLDQLPQNLNGKFGNGLLQMFYCTNIESECDIDCEAWQPFAKSQLVRIIQPNHQPAEVEIPAIEDLFDAKLILSWEEIDDYPNSEEREMYGVSLNDAENELLNENNMYLSAEGDKLAGWPNWIQPIEYPDCPICNHTMNQFIFQLESEDNVPYMWGDVGVGYLLQCPEHKKQVAFLWQCG